MKKGICWLMMLLVLLIPALALGEAEVCETFDDAKAAVASQLEQGATELELHCSEGLFQSLFREGRMYRLMNELGVADFTMQGNTLHQIFLSGLQKMTVPYAQVNTVNEAGEKVSAWRLQGATAFNLLFEEETFAALTRDDYRLIAFLGGAESYSLSYNRTSGLLLFTEVVYTDTPSAYCASETELVDVIRAMGARGVTSFQLMLDQATYDAVTADRFARLYELQAQAGMTSSDLRYSGSGRLLLFDNAVISADATVLTSLADVTAHVEACAARGDGDIAMLLSAEVYDALMEGASALFASDAKVYDLIANAGILTAQDMRFNRHSGAVSLAGVQYYAGTNILRAVESGSLSALTGREQQALTAAQQLAGACKRDTPADTARAIHDALCAMIVYTDDETTDEDDNCIGALLNGQANCDGYADAMLLTGRLAGLNVRYQHGDSLKGGFGSLFSTHMWNLIELDGSWRMIDVTWDDAEDGTLYQWFNIGRDRAALSHVWSEEMTVALLPETDRTTRPVAEFFAASADEVTAAALQAQSQGHRVFDIYVASGSGLGMITAREAALQGLSGTIRYTWMDALGCLHVELVD